MAQLEISLAGGKTLDELELSAETRKALEDRLTIHHKHRLTHAEIVIANALRGTKTQADIAQATISRHFYPHDHHDINAPQEKVGRPSKMTKELENAAARYFVQG